MNMKSTFVLLTVMVLGAAYVHAEGEIDKEILDIKSDLKKEKLFVASYITTTFTTLSFFTSAKPYFCIQASNGQSCQGRNLRRKRKLNIDESLASAGDIDLEHSKSDTEVNNPSSLAAGKLEKFLFTVWKTTTSTVTVTTYSTNTSVTVSVSAQCTHGNFGTIPTCG